jgi:undecaprenyl-diphosphatase
VGFAVVAPGADLVSEILAFDTRLFILLNQQWTAGWLDVAMPFLTDFDHWRIPVIAGLLIALARGSTETRVGVLFAILAVVVADQVSSSGIKPIVDRARPFHAIEGTRQLVGAFSSSFPSSHAANTFAAGTFLALRFRRWWPVLLVPIVVSYSRVYVGVHYPLDVVAGAAIGAGIGFAFAGLERASRMRLEGFFSRRKKASE